MDGKEVKEKFASKNAFRDFMKANPDKWNEYRSALNLDGANDLERLSDEEIEKIESEEKELSDELLADIEGTKVES